MSKLSIPIVCDSPGVCLQLLCFSVLAVVSSRPLGHSGQVRGPSGYPHGRHPGAGVRQAARRPETRGHQRGHRHSAEGGECRFSPLAGRKHVATSHGTVTLQKEASVVSVRSRPETRGHQRRHRHAAEGGGCRLSPLAGRKHVATSGGTVTLQREVSVVSFRSPAGNTWPPAAALSRCRGR